jgi:predicted RNA binding protein YcfA (HicA-like mRNA interferase family)
MPPCALLCCSGQRAESADAVKVGGVIKRLEAAGWFLVATRGSHRQFKHPIRPGRVTVAGKPSDELAPGTLRSIEQQSGVDLR